MFRYWSFARPLGSWAELLDGSIHDVSGKVFGDTLPWSEVRVDSPLPDVKLDALHLVFQVDAVKLFDELRAYRLRWPAEVQEECGGVEIDVAEALAWFDERYGRLMAFAGSPEFSVEKPWELAVVAAGVRSLNLERERQNLPSLWVPAA